MKEFADVTATIGKILVMIVELAAIVTGFVFCVEKYVGLVNWIGALPWFYLSLFLGLIAVMLGVILAVFYIFLAWVILSATVELLGE